METIILIATLALIVAAAVGIIIEMRKPRTPARRDIMNNWKKAGYDYPKNYEKFLEDEE
jgi:hypothetical protein